MIIKNFNELQVGDKVLKSTGEVDTVSKIMYKDNIRGLVILSHDDGSFSRMINKFTKGEFKVVNG